MPRRLRAASRKRPWRRSRRLRPSPTRSSITTACRRPKQRSPRAKRPPPPPRLQPQQPQQQRRRWRSRRKKPHRPLQRKPPSLSKPRLKPGSPRMPPQQRRRRSRRKKPHRPLQRKPPSLPKPRLKPGSPRMPPPPRRRPRPKARSRTGQPGFERKNTCPMGRARIPCALPPLRPLPAWAKARPASRSWPPRHPSHPRLTQAPKRMESAAAAPTLTQAPAEPASPAPGGYFAQVKSDQSRKAAEAELAAVAEKYKAVLGELPLMTRSADLKDRGTWFRVLIGPVKSHDDADNLCKRLKGAGLQDCIVQKLD